MRIFCFIVAIFSFFFEGSSFAAETHATDDLPRICETSSDEEIFLFFRSTGDALNRHSAPAILKATS